MEKEKDYSLSENLTYAKAGDFETTATIIMRPPSMETRKESQKLSQLVTRAFMDARKFTPSDAEREQANSDEELDKESIKVFLLASNVDFSEICDTFDKLAKKACFVAEGIGLESAIIKDMDLADYNNLVCEYIAVFIFPSLFSQV